MLPKRLPLTFGQQHAAMRHYFPQFKCKRVGGVPAWTGTLQPGPTSSVYRVRITMPLPKSPRVWVLSPRLRPDVCHRYADGSLCLYYPPDESWTPGKFIAVTIVPWTAYWLACYELWMHTGEWYGEEAPHGPQKHRN
jgi:hypothetical protein